jgi:hypothetical protein
MNKKDIDLVCGLLKHQGRNDLVALIRDGFGQIEETSQFGSYWNSVISSYVIFLETEKYLEAKKLSTQDKDIILNALLDLYPHGDSSPEITFLEFKILREIPEGYPEESIKNNEDDIVAFEHEVNIQYKFLLEQISKAEIKYKNNDLDGALTNVRSSIEAATFDIFKRITGEEIVGTGRLQDDYKKVKTLLNLAPENKTSNAAKQMVTSFVSAIDAIDEMANAMGDRHLRKVQPAAHHTAFCLNAAKTILNFLYSSLIFQYKEKNTIYTELVNFLDIDNNRILSKEKLLLQPKIKFIYGRCDVFTKNLLKNKLISEFDINSYRNNDIFFCFLEIFSETLTKNDMKFIIDKHSENNQACGLKIFMDKHQDLLPEEWKQDSPY